MQNLIITMRDAKGKSVPVNLGTSVGATLAAPFMADRFKQYGAADAALMSEYVDAALFAHAVTRKDIEAHNSEMGRLFYLKLYKPQGITSLPMLFEYWETGRELSAIPQADLPDRIKYLRAKYDKLRLAGARAAGVVAEPVKEAVKDECKSFTKYICDRYASAVKGIHTAEQYNGMMRALSATLVALAARKATLGFQDAPVADEPTAPSAPSAPVKGKVGNADTRAKVARATRALRAKVGKGKARTSR